MPTPPNLTPFEITLDGPYFPSAPALAARGLQGTIRRGSNVWRDPGGHVRVARGLLETNAVNVGARLFAANIQRASIEGGLVGSRLPFAGLLRLDSGVLLFLSEIPNAQLYIDEVAIPGLTTSATPGRLRVAVPDGVGGYNVFDAGFSKAPNFSFFSPFFTTGTKNMEGNIGIARAPWRTSTNAIGPPSEITYLEVSASVLPLAIGIDVTNGDAQPGQDGWIYCGTRWDDDSGELHVVRYVYIQPRGTFTVTNSSATIIGDGTFWTRDLRPGDGLDVPGAPSFPWHVSAVISDTEVQMDLPWAGSTTPGMTATMISAVADWYNSELGDLLQRDIIKPPPAAGVLQYAGRVLVWGCFGEAGSPTGTVIFPMLEDNPEHCPIRGIRPDGGGDLANVLGADGPLYLMTTLGLEIATVRNDPARPYDVKQIATPGFKSPGNGLLFGDYFYGFNGKPFRTQASKNIDFEFADKVVKDMEDWDPERVVIAGDPKNQAVLYCYFDTTETIVVPFMAQQEQWNPPIYFSDRFLDGAMADNDLYVTVLSGGNTRVNKWEGGAGIGGERFISSQYIDPNYLRSNRLKILAVVGKVGSLSVYAVSPDTDPPDVGDLGAATETFPLSDTSKKEPEIKTQIAGDAYAFRIDFASDDGYFDKLVALGVPRGESR